MTFASSEEVASMFGIKGFQAHVKIFP